MMYFNFGGKHRYYKLFKLDSNIINLGVELSNLMLSIYGPQNREYIGGDDRVYLYRVFDRDVRADYPRNYCDANPARFTKCGNLKDRHNLTDCLTDSEAEFVKKYVDDLTVLLDDLYNEPVVVGLTHKIAIQMAIDKLRKELETIDDENVLDNLCKEEQ
jgi:hypothetical protein